MGNIEVSVKDKVGVVLVVDDIVEGANNTYDVTDMRMTRGRILHIREEEIEVRVMSHKMRVDCIGRSFWVQADKFKKIGHIKPFVREEFLNNLAKGEVEKILEYDLYEADLSGADFSGANLRSADFSGANLRGVDFSGADLSGADLRSANLRSANLRSADFSGADLSGADLRSANLSGADLRSANLSGADLRSANLSDADLSGVFYNEYTSFFAPICPEEGSFIAWKACCDNLIVKLRVPEDAQRSSATSRKCRCSKAEVIQIEDTEGNVLPDDTIAYSRYDCEFPYQKGKIVEVDDFDTNRWDECSTGIHFFMTRREAVLYY